MSDEMNDEIEPMDDSIEALVRMVEEKEKRKNYNGEFIHDFLSDCRRLSHILDDEEMAARMRFLTDFMKKYPDELDHCKEPKTDVHDYLIEDVKHDYAAGGMCCGPCSGPAVVTVKYNDGEKSRYMNCSEFDGLLFFFLTDNDIFSYLMEEEERDEEMEAFLENEGLCYFEDIWVRSHEYYDVYKSIRESKDYNAAKFIRYILNIHNLSSQATEALINRSKGKHLSEFFVSRTRTELKYYDRIDEITERERRGEL